MGKPVTDPALLAILNAPESATPITDARARAVTDPELLAELNREQFDARQMVRNIPGSAVQFAKDITQPIRHPIQTGKALGNVAAGTAQLAMPGEQGKEGYARAVGTGLKERYGGTDALRRTLQNDPVGLASDVAGIFTGGATLAPKAAGNVLRTVGRNIDPVVAAQRAAGAVIPKSATPLSPRSLMESSLKLSTTMKRPERARVVETMLENKALPNERGIDTLREAQAALGDEIDTLIAGAATTGQRVPATRLLRGLRDVRTKLGGAGLEAADDLAAVQGVVDKWLDSLKAQGIRTLGIEDLQKIKTDAYRRIKWEKGGPQQKPMPVQLAHKSIAGEARKQIERQVPEIADVNRRYGNIEATLPVVERSANRIANRDLVGIGTPMKTTAGGAIGGLPGALFGLVSGALDSPVMKARLANRLEALRRKGYGKGQPTNSYTTTRAAAAAAGRTPTEEQE
jgi:hypothetical protein